jgi:hypothetical protein
MGGANDHPSPLEFQYRLRWFILGKHSAAVFRQNKNTEENHEPCLLQPLEMPREFQSINGNGLPNERFIFRKLSEKTIAHYEVIACLSRTQTYIRLRSGFWKHFIWPVS